jgi:hypothetical protein
VFIRRPDWRNDYVYTCIVLTFDIQPGFPAYWFSLKIREGVRKFQPRFASTLGFDKEERPNAESVRVRSLANACSVEFVLSRVSQGCRKLQP